MGQVTEDTIKRIRAYAERGEHFPLTIWEVQQLAYAWVKLRGTEDYAAPQASAEAVRNAALEEAAAAVEARIGVGEPGIDTLELDRETQECANAIRALKQPQEVSKYSGDQDGMQDEPQSVWQAQDAARAQADKDGGQQRADESAVRRALAAASNYIDKLGGDSKSYRAALSATQPEQGERDE